MGCIFYHWEHTRYLHKRKIKLINTSKIPDVDSEAHSNYENSVNVNSLQTMTALRLISER